MKILLLALSLFLHSLLACGQTYGNSNFNLDWKFNKGDIPGAEIHDYDDSKWRDLDLPHDWSIEDLEEQKSSKDRIISGPFDSMSSGKEHSGYTIGGIGWYRKHFKLAQSDTSKVLHLEFDGIYMNPEIWVNGKKVYHQPYGYTGFWIDITEFLSYGEEGNVVAVKVDNSHIASRWYAGSGIYRHVSLRKSNKIHFEPWGIHITTPKVNTRSAEVSVVSRIKNYSGEKQDVSVRIEVLNAKRQIVSSKEISTRIHELTTSEPGIVTKIESPELWSPEKPHLYTMRAHILNGGIIIDSCEHTFGLRTIEFDAENGMFLNGEPIKLKGGAVHANNGCLGSAAHKEAEKRRVQILKACGFNAVRCAHNPPSRFFLDECDKQGLLVINEVFDDWKGGTLADDYKIHFDQWWQHDLENTILRDRNHPSIFTWSIGNQIRNAREPQCIERAHKLAKHVRALDPTRPVNSNIAMFIAGNWLDGSAELWRNYDGIFEAMDICGYSYQSGQYENVHERLPDRIQFSTEINPKHCFKNWMRVMDRDYVIGNFTWTAMDYMGEAGSGWFGFGHTESLFPWHTAFVGDIDICGYRKPRSYYRDILFENGKHISMFVHPPNPTFKGENESLWGWDDVKPSWTWDGYEKDTFNVDVYSRGGRVELFLNDISLGEKSVSRDTEFKSAWNVPYEKGVLMAIHHNGSGATDTSILRTCGKANKVRLIPEKQILMADRQDLCFVNVEIVDRDGNLLPYADNLVEFEIKGEGIITGVGNGDPTSIESYQRPFRKAFEGKCLLVVKATDKEGTIRIKASSKGLKTGEIELMQIN